MAYATRATLKDRLGITGAGDDDLLDKALEWAQRWIEDYCHRTFEAGTFTKYYGEDAIDRFDQQTLVVDDDLLTIGTLTNADSSATVITSDKYWLAPRNETPKQAIKLKSAESWQFATDKWIEVYGTWGYSATADALIESTCLQLAEWKYRAKDLQVSASPFSEGEVLARLPGFPRDVLKDLEPRVRLTR